MPKKSGMRSGGPSMKVPGMGKVTKPKNRDWRKTAADHADAVGAMVGGGSPPTHDYDK